MKLLQVTEKSGSEAKSFGKREYHLFATFMLNLVLPISTAKILFLIPSNYLVALLWAWGLLFSVHAAAYRNIIWKRELREYKKERVKK